MSWDIIKLRHPKVDMEIPPVEKITMGDVVEYLNKVLEKYGPPCDWCEHFKLICKKKHRPRKYYPEAGPYEDFTFRKHCKDFEPELENKEEREEKIRMQVGAALDCFNQKYCRRS